MPCCGVGGDIPVAYWQERVGTVPEKQLSEFLKAIVTH